MQALVTEGLLTADELEACIVSEFNPSRCAFHRAPEVWASDVLNLGVSPAALLSRIRQRFEAAGGHVYEHTAFRRATVCADGVDLVLAPTTRADVSVGDTNRPNALDPGATEPGATSGGERGEKRTRLTARLVLDCMGHYSSIAQQVRSMPRSCLGLMWFLFCFGCLAQQVSCD